MLYFGIKGISLGTKFKVDQDGNLTCNGASINSATISEGSIGSANISECDIDDCTISNGTIGSADISDCSISNCSISNLNYAGDTVTWESLTVVTDLWAKASFGYKRPKLESESKDYSATVTGKFVATDGQTDYIDCHQSTNCSLSATAHTIGYVSGVQCTDGKVTRVDTDSFTYYTYSVGTQPAFQYKRNKYKDGNATIKTTISDKIKTEIGFDSTGYFVPYQIGFTTYTSNFLKGSGSSADHEAAGLGTY